MTAVAGAGGRVIISWTCSNTLTSASRHEMHKLYVPILAITNITYALAGATGATVSGLPSGVTANYVSGLVTISGTPTASGLFNYTVTPTGGCTGTTATGSITVNAPPAITTSGTINMLCTSAGAQTGTMAYSATTGSPVSYSIDWDGTANGEGLLDQTTTAFSFAAGGGDLNNIDVTAGIPADTYHGVMTITTAGGCTSTQAVSLLVNAPPTTADAGLPQTICSNSTATLAGNTPVTGTGEWSVSIGPGGLPV